MRFEEVTNFNNDLRFELGSGGGGVRCRGEGGGGEPRRCERLLCSNLKL